MTGCNNGHKKEYRRTTVATGGLGNARVCVPVPWSTSHPPTRPGEVLVCGGARSMLMVMED